MRSWLFVPADSERKLAKAVQSGADTLILDLEDSVSPARKTMARDLARAYLRDHGAHTPVWIRVNDLGGGELLPDLIAVVPARPAGIFVPKVGGPEELQKIADYLEALEASQGIDSGRIAMAAIIETPAAIMRIGEFARHSPRRLTALAWGAEDLAAALDAGGPRTAHGAWRQTHQYARSQCLLAAKTSRVVAIDTVYVDHRDGAGLAADCAASHADGFSGRLAIHPDQVPIINQAYLPDAAALELARRIVDAFAAGAGAVSIDGKMYDVAHLTAARRLLDSSRDKKIR